MAHNKAATDWALRDVDKIECEQKKREICEISWEKGDMTTEMCEASSPSQGPSINYVSIFFQSSMKKKLGSLENSFLIHHIEVNLGKL